jgi:CubicO group peptidase (beta-lactamase class C family)
MPAPLNSLDPMWSRRSVLRGAGIAGLTLALGGAAGPGPRRAVAAGGVPSTRAPARWLTPSVLQAFEADVQAALGTFGIPGAAVALVEGDQVVYARGFGAREVNSQAPVTERTRFRIGSNGKSMTALLIATFVDEGLLAWDQPVADVWPDFRAPTADLTRSLRVRDLMGMGSGIAESPTLEFFFYGGTDSARDVLRSVAYLPLIAPPDTEFFYNNTLVAVAGCLGPIVQQTPLTDLMPAYARLLQQRVFDPIGMADAAIGADPRPLGDDWAGSYTRDLFDRLAPLPFVSIDGYAPAGAHIASAMDMARYLIMQMNGGVTAGGQRIVSAAALAETHRPGISLLTGASETQAAELAGITALNYGLGWLAGTFRDGRHRLWHTGGIDGAGSVMGYFPAERVGFVALTNLDPGYSGSFTNWIPDNIQSRLFGLNPGGPAASAASPAALRQQNADLAGQTQPVNPTEVAPYLGLYGAGFALRLDTDGALWLDHDIRSMPLLAHTDGGYIVVAGGWLIQGKRVSFATDQDGQRVMTIEGYDPVRWLTGS